MRSYVKESLEKGHIRPSSSPLGAGFFFVAKKDGSLRPCIDYRLLNKITVKFQYPLPLLSDLFARIKGVSWFTKIDLRGVYNLVRIKRGDEWKTAFNTPEGHFEYLVMPFGLANAPSVFQSFMHDIFREYLDKFLIVYLDDILIFSDDWESHVKQVRTVFQVLRANSLFVKGSKCLFGVQKVSFLGFIFSPSTIEMDPVKVQAIHNWTQPTSLKSMQKFLGFANFYRRFICNFSRIAKPLTDLTKKGADLVNWSSAAVEAFQELKRHFSSAPVLCQPDVSLPFQVEVDASEIGAGAVLSQRSSDCSVMKPCAFFSRKFSPAERNYDVGNRELLAMKWAFEEWRHWLEGAKHRVVVLTDHKNLTYLESAKRLNPRQARWSLFFARFDFVISYLPGSKNVKADALSRSFVPDSPGVSEPAGILKEGRKLQYLVKWKGYAQEDNSWVFASDVHAPDLVRAFHGSSWSSWELCLHLSLFDTECTTFFGLPCDLVLWTVDAEVFSKGSVTCGSSPAGVAVVSPALPVHTAGLGSSRSPGRPAVGAVVAAAMSFLCCWCCGDGGSGHIPLKEMPAVQLDTQHMGTDVVIVKNGRRICGTGACLANAPLHQNKSYFEFKVQSTGVWGIGVATQKANLNQIPLGRDVHSLVIRNDGAIYYNDEEKNRLPANSLPQEGDVVGITYDHVELNVYLNGKNMLCPSSGIRGTVYPVVYGFLSLVGGSPLSVVPSWAQRNTVIVDDSAILDCQFSEFYHTPPPGFEKILFEQQIF
ncbi:unnamed protein product [Ranitomeya imitator]|uniref:ribonuclease H n=1 Tax=Ranitomeya imitator TaxID=111125 RepID=A0ABN9L6R6_9NEOB|nr:unnamed protein product [Ranitomeya imitator]